HIMTVLHHNRIQEMFMQVVHVLEDPIFKTATDADVVKDGQMLSVFTQTHSSSVRADGKAKLGGHQQDCQYFVDAAQPAAIDLTELDSFSLHQLFENHTILAMFTRCDADGLDSFGDGRMPQNIIRTGRFLDPPRLEPCQSLHMVDGFSYVPVLV